MAETILFPDDITTLSSKLHDVDMLLLGEIHGVKENVLVIESLVDLLTLNSTRPLVLAFEWAITAEELDQINLYIRSQADMLPNARFFADSDGRFTQAHVELFQKLRNELPHKNVIIEAFDEETGADPELSLANRLLMIREKHGDALILVETGVMHARQSPYRDYEEIDIEPMASHLHNKIKVISVFIRYQSGTVVVDGETYNITDAASQIDGPGDAFNYELIVQQAHPA